MLVECSCGKKLNIREELLGKRIRCPACGHAFQPTAGNDGEQAAIKATGSKDPRRSKPGPARKKAARARSSADDSDEDADSEVPSIKKKRGVSLARNLVGALVLCAVLGVAGVVVWNKFFAPSGSVTLQIALTKVDVFVDDRKIDFSIPTEGRLNLIVDLQPGKHTVKVVNDKLESFVRDINVKAGQSETVRVFFGPAAQPRTMKDFFQKGQPASMGKGKGKGKGDRGIGKMTPMLMGKGRGGKMIVTPEPRVPAPGRLSQLAHVNGLAYSPDGKPLATVQFFGNGAAYYALQVWDLKSGQQLFKFHEGNDSVQQPFFSPNNRFLACFYIDSTKVKVWDVSSGKLVQTFSAPKDARFNDYLFDFSPDSKFAFAANERNICRMSLDTGDVQQLEHITIDPHQYMAGMPTASFIALGGKDLILVDEKDGKHRSACPLSGATTAMAFSGNGKVLAVAYAEGHIDVFDTESWKPPITFQREGTETFHYYRRLRMSQDGKSLLALPIFKEARSYPGRVEIWDLPSSKMRKFDFPSFSALAFAPDGNTIVVAIDGGRILFADAGTGKEKAAGPAVAAP